MKRNYFSLLRSPNGLDLTRIPNWLLVMAMGFIVQLLLILFVATIGVRELQLSEDRLNTISQQQILKLELSKKMHAAVRERTTSIVRATMANDPFELDYEYTQFNQLASDFSQARIIFISLPLSTLERTLLDAQAIATRNSYQLAERTFELAIADKREMAMDLLVNKTLPAQNVVLDILSRLDESVRHDAHTAIENTKAQHAAAKNWITLLSIAAFFSGLVVSGIVLHFTNKAGREREHLATHDSLTGLPNRLLLIGRLEQSIALAQRQKSMIGVMFIDLDRFKLVNDTLGHAVGDELIRQVAKRLAETVRNQDIVARLGGDEFIVVANEIEKIDQILFVVERVIEAITHDYHIEDHDLYVTCSVGISIYPHDGKTPIDLLKHADTAMYHAKESGRNRYQLFDPVMNARIAQRLELETEVRQGIVRNEFHAYYQPQVNLETKRIHVVEALMRWHHPTRGIVGPDVYLDLMEETGIIVELGRRLMLDACTQCKQWHTDGHPELAVSINLSSKEFWQNDLIEFVESALAQTKLPASGLHLELTESILMQDIDQAVDRIKCLKNLGTRVAVDDFGTGYSSLAHLKHFPVDTLKIDRFFVKDIPNQPIDAAIIHAIIDLSKNLGLDTVVEGVEDTAQLLALRELGCKVIQGFIISKPLPSKDISAMLERDWTGELTS